MRKIIFLFCLLTCCSQVIATDCNSCDSCETALNVVGADTVVLTTDITSSGTCINDPANSDNKIFDCQGHSITGITTGYGFYVNGENNVTLQNCVIDNFQYNTYFYNSRSITVDNCTFNNSRTDHIWLNNADNATVKNSGLYNSGHESISVDYTDNATIENNILIIALQQGIEVQSSSYNTITNNYIHSCAEGIDMHWGHGDANYNLVTYNTIINASAAFNIWSTDDGTVSNHNNFSHNKVYNMTHEDVLWGPCPEHDGYEQACMNGWKGRVIHFEGWDTVAVPGSLYCTNEFENNTYNDIPVFYSNSVVNISDAEYSQVMLCGADNSVLNNITVQGDDYNGLDIYFSDNVSIHNSFVNDTYTGIESYRSTNVNITDTVISNSQLTDITLNNGVRYPYGHCSVELTNVNGSNGNPIYFLNDGSNLSDVDAAQVILCNSDNSVLDNVRILNTGTKNNGMVFYNSSNIIIKNSVVNNSAVGMYFMQCMRYDDYDLQTSNNVTVDNVTITNGNCDGFQTGYSGASDVTITNSNFSNNDRIGLKPYTIAGITVRDTIVSNNGYVGVYIAGNSGFLFDNVSIYNNHLAGISEIWGSSDGGAINISNSYVYHNGHDFADAMSCRGFYDDLAPAGFDSSNNFYGGSLVLDNVVFYDNNNTEMRFGSGGLTTITLKDVTIENYTSYGIFTDSVSLIFEGNNVFKGGSPLYNTNTIMTVNDDLIISG